MIWRRRDDVVQQITVESPSERLRLCHDRSDYRFQTALSKSFLSSDSTIPSTLEHDGCYQREIKNQYPMFIFITFAKRLTPKPPDWAPLICCYRYWLNTPHVCTGRTRKKLMLACCCLQAKQSEPHVWSGKFDSCCTVEAEKSAFKKRQLWWFARSALR